MTVLMGFRFTSQTYACNYDLCQYYVSFSNMPHALNCMVIYSPLVFENNPLSIQTADPFSSSISCIMQQKNERSNLDVNFDLHFKPPNHHMHLVIAGATQSSGWGWVCSFSFWIHPNNIFYHVDPDEEGDTPLALSLRMDFPDVTHSHTSSFSLCFFSAPRQNWFLRTSVWYNNGNFQFLRSLVMQ